ncbi:unnamed protein product [Caenorhabditis sp. 36 PRJEB53466]|nr:unnamed protein product [Caenorhabditis sp. 36 PRJEB53466]
MVRKDKSRQKEQLRAQNINVAFNQLQQHIPYLSPEERKQLPKIKTLRLAAQYIAHLSQLLEGNVMLKTDCEEEPRPLAHSDFRCAVSSEMRIRNSYRERAHAQEMDSETVRRILAREESRTQRMRREMEQKDSSPRPFGSQAHNSHNFRRISENELDFYSSPNTSHSTNFSQSPENHCNYPITPLMYPPQNFVMPTMYNMQQFQ